MNKIEKKLKSGILDLDCYDQELWVVDNEIFIQQSSNEFKSFIKGLDFKTGQSALENLNADYYAQTMRGQ
jgi:hypothetical protein